MVKRNVFVVLLFVILLVGVLLEQNYIDNSFESMKENVSSLLDEIENENLDSSTQDVFKIKKYWQDREIVLSLFVDYREIEQIGRQIELIVAHLNNVDFELASVECELLLHIVKTYHKTVCFDWQNII